MNKLRANLLALLREQLLKAGHLEANTAFTEETFFKYCREYHKIPEDKQFVLVTIEDLNAAIEKVEEGLFGVALADGPSHLRTFSSAGSCLDWLESRLESSADRLLLLQNILRQLNWLEADGILTEETTIAYGQEPATGKKPCIRIVDMETLSMHVEWLLFGNVTATGPDTTTITTVGSYLDWLGCQLEKEETA